jgi:hypothetical protein
MKTTVERGRLVVWLGVVMATYTYSGKIIR